MVLLKIAKGTSHRDRASGGREYGLGILATWHVDAIMGKSEVLKLVPGEASSGSGGDGGIEVRDWWGFVIRKSEAFKLGPSIEVRTVWGWNWVELGRNWSLFWCCFRLLHGQPTLECRPMPS